MVDGTFVIDVLKVQEWQKGVRAIDARAEFKKNDPIRIRHFRCGKWIQADLPYDCTKFRKHVKGCVSRNGGGGSVMITSYFKTTSQPNKRPDPESVLDSTSDEEEDEERNLCRGITTSVSPRVKKYLARTGSRGGGGMSVIRLAQEMFGKTFSKHKVGRKVDVKEAQYRSHTWRNDHFGQCVYAVKCLPLEGLTLHKGMTLCPPCAEVLCSRSFRKAIAKPRPSIKNYVFLNKEYQNEELGTVFVHTKGLAELFDVKVNNNPMILIRHIVSLTLLSG